MDFRYVGFQFLAMVRVININPGSQTGIFQSRQGFLELEHFDKYFIYNTPKETPAGKNSGVF